MPAETQQAVNWALQQDGVTLTDPGTVVDKVREYFNMYEIVYDTFSFDDLEPFLN